jgi:hypothetical protein
MVIDPTPPLAEVVDEIHRHSRQSDVDRDDL